MHIVLNQAQASFNAVETIVHYRTEVHVQRNIRTNAQDDSRAGATTSLIAKRQTITSSCSNCLIHTLIGREDAQLSVTTFEKLENQKVETLRTVGNWPASRYFYKPSPDVWSAAEVLDHIVNVEVRITGAARKGLQDPHGIGIRDRLGFVFLERIFQSERKVKVPASASAVLPQPGVDLASTVERWELARKDLAQLLSGLEPSQFGSGVFRHPVSGWMTVPQVLRFFSVHIHHHGFQLARLSAVSEGL